jgi:hypothetical protein
MQTENEIKPNVYCIIASSICKAPVVASSILYIKVVSLLFCLGTNKDNMILV